MPEDDDDPEEDRDDPGASALDRDPYDPGVSSLNLPLAGGGRGPANPI
jgi:hypothetical protein